jgi:hypothetical protein
MRRSLIYNRGDGAPWWKESARRQMSKIIDKHDPRFETTEAARVAGLSQQNVLRYRREFELLGGSKPGVQSKGYRLSLCEVLIVVTVGALIRRGMDPKDACKAENFLLEATFAGLLEGEPMSPIFGFHAKGRDPGIEASLYFWGRDQTLGEILDQTPGGVMVLDLERIIAHTLRSLRIEIRKTAS